MAIKEVEQRLRRDARAMRKEAPVQAAVSMMSGGGSGRPAGPWWMV